MAAARRPSCSRVAALWLTRGTPSPRAPGAGAVADLDRGHLGRLQPDERHLPRLLHRRPGPRGRLADRPRRPRRVAAPRPTALATWAFGAGGGGDRRARAGRAVAAARLGRRGCPGSSPPWSRSPLWRVARGPPPRHPGRGRVRRRPPCSRRSSGRRRTRSRPRRPRTPAPSRTPDPARRTGVRRTPPTRSATCSPSAPPPPRADPAAGPRTPARSPGSRRSPAPTPRPASSSPPIDPVMPVGGFNGTDPSPTLAAVPPTGARAGGSTGSSPAAGGYVPETDGEPQPGRAHRQRRGGAHRAVGRARASSPRVVDGVRALRPAAQLTPLTGG